MVPYDTLELKGPKACGDHAKFERDLAPSPEHPPWVDGGPTERAVPLSFLWPPRVVQLAPRVFGSSARLPEGILASVFRPPRG